LQLYRPYFPSRARKRVTLCPHFGIYSAQPLGRPSLRDIYPPFRRLISRNHSIAQCPSHLSCHIVTFRIEVGSPPCYDTTKGMVPPRKIVTDIPTELCSIPSFIGASGKAAGSHVHVKSQLAPSLPFKVVMSRRRGRGPSPMSSNV
jgi:hypothetical protein